MPSRRFPSPVHPSPAQRRRHHDGSQGNAGNTAETFLVHFFGSGLVDNRHVVDRIGELVVDRAKRRVTLAGRPLRLTATEYRLLHALSLDAGGAPTCETLMRRIWGQKGSGNMAALRRAVTKLRRKLGDDARKQRQIIGELSLEHRRPEAG